MFTGIVREKGRVVTAERRDDALRLVVASAVAAGEEIGASVAIDGCCLTVVEQGDGEAAFDLTLETLSRTTLGRLAPGDEPEGAAAQVGVGQGAQEALARRREGRLLAGHGFLPSGGQAGERHPLPDPPGVRMMNDGQARDERPVRQREIAALRPRIGLQQPLQGLAVIWHA